MKGNAHFFIIKVTLHSHYRAHLGNDVVKSVTSKMKIDSA